METVVREERSHLGRLVGVIVVREFGKWEEIDPIVLVVRDVRAEVPLKGLIGALRETISLRVVRGRVFVVDLELAGELRPESRDEGRAAVGDDSVGKTVVAEDSIKEEPSETGGVERFGGGDEVGVAGETVNYNPNRVVAVRRGKFDYVVHGDSTPRTERDVEGLEEPKGLVSRSFDATALVARADVCAHVPSDSRPGVVALDELECRATTGMTCSRRIVKKMQNISVQWVGHEKETVVVDDVAF